MDIEDTKELFDRDRIANKLALFLAKYLQEMMQDYPNRENPDPEHDVQSMPLIALQQAVADIVVQNNRILWSAVQRLLAKETNENG